MADSKIATSPKSPKRKAKAIRIGSDRIPIGAGIWLLWTGIGMNAVLSSMGYHWTVAQFVAMVFFVTWGFYNVDLKAVVRRATFGLIEIFFKDFDVAGVAKVPLEGPIILACAPHNNQFVDAICVLKALECRKDIGFLTAAVTMRKKYIGSVAGALNGISVERPQDVAKVGSGRLEFRAGEASVTGTDTKFLSEVKVKCLIKIADGKFKGCCAKVAEVISDTELTLASPLKADSKNEDESVTAGYKVIPHLDQSHVFKSVFKRLQQGSAVGIFPEGGSHDRTKLLPLKAGITIMALGAMAEREGLKVRILPVGINYFKGHKFRSRVFIDIGSAITPTAEQVRMYAKGGTVKRQACAALLDDIMAGIKSVTTEAPDFSTLQFFRAMRRLYWDGSRRMTARERFGLTNAFARGYEVVKDQPRVKALHKKVQEYRRMLKDYAISDYRVQMCESAGDEDENFLGKKFLIGLILYRVIILLVFALAAIPGSIAAAPFFLVSSFISKKKAKEAAAKSSVKIAGRDLLATWKLLVAVALVPALHGFYTFMFWLTLGEAAAITYFFFMPFISLFTVLSWEMGTKVWVSIRPLVLALGKQQGGLALVAKRREARTEVLKVVKKFDWDKSLKDDEEMKHLFRRASSTVLNDDYDDMDTCLG